MKENKFESIGTEKLSEAELSRQLGRYQRQERFYIRFGLICVAVSLILCFAVREPALKAVLVGVLFSVGLCCVIFLAEGTKKKLKKLMREQLGGYFQAELEKAFGPERHSAELRIDEAFLKENQLVDRGWEESEVEEFREGVYRGVRFSAANVRLYHVYQRGNSHDGYETCRDMVFKGVVIRCETQTAAPSPVRGNGRDIPEPRLAELADELTRNVEGTLLGLCWKGNVLSLALETDYGFASVASHVDLRDLDALRRSFTTTLREMEGLLDLVLNDTALFWR